MSEDAPPKDDGFEIKEVTKWKRVGQGKTKDDFDFQVVWNDPVFANDANYYPGRNFPDSALGKWKEQMTKDRRQQRASKNQTQLDSDLRRIEKIHKRRSKIEFNKLHRTKKKYSKLGTIDEEVTPPQDGVAD
jgi:hypothetical protein